MINEELWSGLRDLPEQRPILLQGSIREHMLSRRIKKEVIIASLIDYLFMTKKAKFICVPGFTFSVFESLKYSNILRPEIGYISDFIYDNFTYTRTSHPMYSFILLERHNTNKFEEISTLDGSHCFGYGSFYDYLTKLNAVQVCINLPDKSCTTYYHHAERIIEAQHRFDKKFRVEIECNSIKSLRDIYVYVRKNGIQTDVSGVESLMWQLNIWRGLKPIPSKPTERWMALTDCLDLFKSMTPRDHSKLLYKRI
jgi:aminoglycoside N3'-acetyltransferase